ncbi:unnamed protein product [Lepeophtheirus salmonis]|uniref:(salmon louse) hypothetical protein n=1 Tax=Lepeophtheirus salmonis TaxID=72036 RepID=A0A7R8CTL3_LEPSM|nr:unnamed protein product [Lepeophtheirus salmonis]CAF2925427.1 unnamed protein product [Lepeophtheirus salmonis]
MKSRFLIINKHSVKSLWCTPLQLIMLSTSLCRAIHGQHTSWSTYPWPSRSRTQSALGLFPKGLSYKKTIMRTVDYLLRWLPPLPPPQKIHPGLQFCQGQLAPQLDKEPPTTVQIPSDKNLCTVDQSKNFNS